jgi:hypothetical protein
MLRAAGRGARAGRPELAVEAEEPQIIAVRAAREGAAGGVEGDDLIAVE